MKKGRAAADARYMRLALAQAARGVGRTAPNPAVGALVVKGGKIVGRGFHARAGGPHAEVVALEAAGARAARATLYTTLEPCDHHGRTPPCTAAILAAGVARVVYASSDPNPLVNGRGVRRLERAGVAVTGQVLEADADALNRPFLTAMRQGRAFVTLKVASTLDGKLAAQGGDSRWITGPQARAAVHGLRDRADAILVGAGTALADDPALTTRLPGGRQGRNPVRLVLDAALEVPPSARVYDTFGAGRAVAVAGPRPPRGRVEALAARGVEVWKLPAPRGKVDLPALLARLAREGLLHLLVEGGAQVAGALLAAGLVDELWLFLGPKLVGAEGVTWSGPLGLGRMADALTWRIDHLERFGPDLLLRATPLRAAGRARAGSRR